MKSSDDPRALYGKRHMETLDDHRALCGEHRANSLGDSPEAMAHRLFAVLRDAQI